MVAGNQGEIGVRVLDAKLCEVCVVVFRIIDNEDLLFKLTKQRTTAFNSTVIGTY
jgi:hypothetical protein